MKNRNLQVVEKIISEAHVALSFIEHCDFDAFNENELLKRAVCMTVINVGELVKNLDNDFRALHRNVPWKDIAGFRDIAAHKYQTLRMEDVYATVTDDFPELISVLEEIMNCEDGSEKSL